MEVKENKNTTYQNLWDTAKAVLRGKLIALYAYIRKIGNVSGQQSKLLPQESRNRRGKINAKQAE